MTASPVIIELLDRAGGVSARHRCHELPVTLGRAYHNDVIVDDPFVAPAHVRIERRADGVIVARDMGTRNGMHIVSKRRFSLWHDAVTRFGEVVLTADTQVRVGHSTFRVRRVDQAVAPERLDTTAHTWEGLRPAMLAFLMLTLVALFEAWTEDTSTQDSFAYETNLAAVLGVLVIWGGFWALLNRLFAGRARVGRHLLIGATGVVVTVVASLAAEMLGYAFSLPGLTQFDSYVSLAVLSVAIYFHMATITPLSLAFARQFAVVFAMLTIGLFGLYRYSKEHHFGDSLYMSSLQWPAIRVATPVSTEAFVKEMGDLKARADLRRNDNVGAEDSN
jgi:pSer/pThr/pTyr-binding forkhead associated (FHA) protein